MITSLRDNLPTDFHKFKYRYTMQAMILAAGFGTRLLPFTKNIPKPLFTIAERPILDIIIRNLQQAGFSAIMINTHHLHHKIAAFISKQFYTIPVHIRHEPVILGTGGAIKNISDFLNDQPLMVINSDIVTDIDLKKVYQFHMKHPDPVTLVLHDDPEFNHVSINKDGFITGFRDQKKSDSTKADRKLSFTGIHVLNHEAIGVIPDSQYSNVIDVYKKMLSGDEKLRAFISNNCYWRDIGTPERYKDAVFKEMAPKAFKEAFPDFVDCRIKKTEVKGDGSDRKWLRLIQNNRSLIMVDHGIRKKNSISEMDAFIAIGRHLYAKGLPVPKIHLYDAFSGLAFLEDLGDINLQKVANEAKNLKDIIFCYQSVIHLLIKLSITGKEGFDPAWTHQTPTYDKRLILENECRYFVEAFLNGYLKWDTSFIDLQDDFFLISENALASPLNGFMHRDMQSRNIMIKNNRIYFIDFQGGRFGPIQYDLASLLIDPYVDLPYPVRIDLLDYTIEKLSSILILEKKKFCTCFDYCAISRNLQILGAFGYLSRVKKKTHFEQYIPAAVKTLKQLLQQSGEGLLSGLKTVVEKIPNGGIT